MSYFTDFSKIDLNKYYFDAKAADSAVRYFEKYCYHVKGNLAGTPFILEEWQKKRIIEPLFGWKHIEPTEVKAANGQIIKLINRRKYRKVYIEIPKKNGKSTLLSGLGQIALDIDPEQGSEIVGLAWGRKQASIIFDMVEKSVRKNPRLKDNIKYYRSSKVLLSKDGNKRYSLWTKEAGGEDGQFPQWVFVDELHEHKNDGIVKVAEKSMMGRMQPVSVTITTAGSNLDGIGYERREYCREVVEGLREDESQLVCIYCADLKDDIYDEKTWFKANPQLGKSIPLIDFLEEVKNAKISAANENSFKRYFLNIWNNSKDAWIPDTTWTASQWEFDIDQLKGAVCYGGLDLSSTSDITAFSLIFPIEDKFISLNWYWLPEVKAAQSADHENSRYADWVRDGRVIETSGDVIDYDFVTDKIRELCSLYDVQSIGVDKYNAVQLTVKLQEEGLPLIFFKQDLMTMNSPTKELFRLITEKRFNHLGDPVLRWMAGNAVTMEDTNGNVKIVKNHAKRRLKVDGIITNIMGLSLAMDIEIGSYLNKSEMTFI